MTMGIKKANGQKVLCFTCTQCKKKEVIDFRQYPICKNCNKTNTKLAKRQKKEDDREKTREKIE
jgi:hypothetical protein